MWTLGREREKLHAARFARDETQRGLLFAVIDAVHDLKEGHGRACDFVEPARRAMIEGGSAAWQNAASWIRQVAGEDPAVLALWDELAVHNDWRIRWRVSCCLYLDIPEAQSDGLFSFLRFDQSKKVRDYAISRYENRADEHGNVAKRFDASQFGE